MHRAGKYWEQQAEAFLLKQGLSLVARNFLTQLGEIDLIMRDESRLIFVEVRYRRRSRFTSAAGSVTQQKQKRLEKCAKLFRKQHQKWSDFPCRFDVIAYDEDSQVPNAIWLCAVFESTDW